MESAEQYIARWRAAGLLEEVQAEAIRVYEARLEKPQGRQWQVLLALILGGILLGAGVLLFVAAHWDLVSPGSRLALVLGMLVFFHGLGLLVRERFVGFATAMHALGTVSAGAAIALIGQIFNMQEHWPAAVMLWALCAGAGWYLLRDQFQQTLTLLLVPAWIVAEFDYRVEPYQDAGVYLARVGLVIGAALLASFLHSRKRAVFGILFACGAVLVPVSITVLSEGFPDWGSRQPGSMTSMTPMIPMEWRVVTWLLIALTATVAGWEDRRALVPVATAAALAWALPWTQTQLSEEGFQDPYVYSGSGLLFYLLVAVAAVILVAWGVRIVSRALVNYGIAAFALTVCWFYFSSVMDKLNRSFSLILLGVLFLGGGWLLETTRRRLVEHMQPAAEDSV